MPNHKMIEIKPDEYERPTNIELVCDGQLRYFDYGQGERLQQLWRNPWSENTYWYNVPHKKADG